MHFDCILCVFVSRTWLVVGTLRLQTGLHPYVTSATATPGLATMSSTLTVRALYPADDVVQAFSDFAAVLAWSKAKEEDLQFVLGLIGDETMDDFTELASIPIHLIIECIGEWVKKKSPPPLQQSRLARFINVVRLKSGLEPEDLLPVPPPQAAPTPDPQILAELGCRSIMHYTSYLRTKDCTNNGYVMDMLEHNTMINIDTGVHMISYITQT